MGNVYTYGECDHCRKVTRAEHEYTFIVHRDSTPINRMTMLGYPVGKIAAHFCGFCGGFVDVMTVEVFSAQICTCGHFQYQGWNYEAEEERWIEPEHWWDGEDWEVPNPINDLIHKGLAAEESK